MTQFISRIFFNTKFVGEIPIAASVNIKVAGIDTLEALIAALLHAVSVTADSAHFLETPAFYSSFSSEKTSIPFSVSAILMKYVLQKLAQAPAVPPTIVFKRRSFFPVAVFVIPAVNFLNVIATDKEDPTAAQYPLNKSISVY